MVAGDRWEVLARGTQLPHRPQTGGVESAPSKKRDRSETPGMCFVPASIASIAALMGVSGVPGGAVFL
jgi:hypothetical protein